MLQQPVTDALAGARCVLLAGCGGGYDVFGALPLMAELTASGRTVHLANLSFTNLRALAGAVAQPGVPNLYEVSGAAATEDAYCPEAWLARWLGERGGGPVWCFEKTGVAPLAAAYRWLIARHEIDAVVLVNGGIDAILRGDEASIGTPEEDLTSLVAVGSLDVPSKLVACVGLGAEQTDGICHAQAFERIAELTRAGAFLGVAGITAGSPSARFYTEALDYVLAHQARQRGSHIHGVVRRSIAGDFGDSGQGVWLSPLLSLCWFFRLEPILATHRFAAQLARTETIGEVTMFVHGLRKSVRIRDRERIPI